MPNIQEKLKFKGYRHFDPLRWPSKRLVRQLGRKSSFYPLIHFVILHKKFSKSTDVKEKERHIYFASHFDRYQYAYFAEGLSTHYERWLNEHGLSENIIAYRSLGKNNIHFAKEAFDFVKSHTSFSVLTTDISGFFDSLNHLVLKDTWQRVVKLEKLNDIHYALFKNITRYAFVEMQDLLEIQKEIKREKPIRRYLEPEEFRRLVRKRGLIKTNSKDFGIPQGLPISALLSNIYMMDFDSMVKAHIDEIGGFYRRYSDDIFISVPQELMQKTKDLLNRTLEKLHLGLNPQKTETYYPIDEKGNTVKPNIQYLGFVLEGRRILLRSSSLSKYFRKLNRRLKVVKSKQKIADKITFRKRLYENYSHLGRRNFIRYSYTSSEIFDEPAIRGQVRRHWIKMHRELG